MDRTLNKYDSRRMRFAFLAVVLVSLFVLPVYAQDRELHFDAKHRVTAHGMEFNGLVMSADAQRLFVATETGDTIVWNIASDRVEQTLNQPGPVHLIAALAGAQEFITAGSSHFKPHNAVVRRWDAKEGTYVELEGVDKNSFPAALATEPKIGLIAVTTLEGAIHVWDASSNKQIATWNIKDIPTEIAIVGRNVYVATIDRKSFDENESPNDAAIISFNVDEPLVGPGDFFRQDERRVQSLATTPDNRALIVTYNVSGEGPKTVLLDPISKAEIASLPNDGLAWIDSAKALIFDWKFPKQVVQIQSNGLVTTEKLENLKSDMEGKVFGLSGQVANAAGSKAWATYSRAGGLVEFDLSAKKVRPLIFERSGAYSISVDSADGEEGHLLTGGADGYVRLWKLSDISLIKEFRILGPDYFVRDALLLPGAAQAVVGLVKVQPEREQQLNEPVQVVVLDLETGQHRKVDEAYLWRSRIAVADNQIILAEGDRLRFIAVDSGQVTRELRLPSPVLTSTISENRRWLALLDNAQKLTILDLKTLKRRRVVFKPKDAGPLAVTNDGRYVSLVAHGGRFLTYDLKTAKLTESVLKEIRDVHSNVDFLTLANDDKWIVVTGNHGDVGVFDRATARLVSYTRVSAAAFYIETAWIRDNRIIFTTDIGVLFDGRLK